MEDSRPPVSEDETHLPLDKDEKRHRLLAPLQNRWLELFSDKPKIPRTEEIDDKEEEKKDSKLSRLKRNLSKIFGRTVNTELIPVLETSPSTATSESRVNLPTEQPEDHIEGLDDENPLFTALPDILSPVASQNTELREQVASPTNTAFEGETKIEHDEAPLSAKPILDETSKGIVLPETPYRATPQELEGQQPPALEGPLPSPEITDHQLHYEDVTQSKIPVERLPQTAASSQEEVYEARKKIERKVERQTKKLQREIKKHNQELERTIKKAGQRPETAPSQPERPIVTSSRIIEQRLEQLPPRSFEKPLERLQPMEPLRRVEVPTRQSAPETYRGLPSAPESPVIQTPELPRPEQVLEKVVVAAEHNEPIEQRYEQRHEVKDIDSVQANAPIPIGQVVTEALDRYHDRTTTSSLSSAESLKRTIMKQQAGVRQEELYGKAVRWGFWSAITIIVFGAIAYLLLR